MDNTTSNSNSNAPPPTELGTVAAFISKTGTILDPLYEASYVGGTQASPSLHAISRVSEANAAKRLEIELENIGATAQVRIFHNYQEARDYAIRQRTALNTLRDVTHLESVIDSFAFSPEVRNETHNAIRTLRDRLEDVAHNRTH